MAAGLSAAWRLEPQLPTLTFRLGGPTIVTGYYSGGYAIEREARSMNRVVHFEIPADDLERAKKFCGDNFGWKLNQLGPEMGSYVLVQTGPTDAQGMPQHKAFINGGLMKRDPSARSPVLVLAVDDADAAVEKIEKSGGRLVGEILDIPNVGRYARVQDTEGNVIGVIKPTMP